MTALWEVCAWRVCRYIQPNRTDQTLPQEWNALKTQAGGAQQVVQAGLCLVSAVLDASQPGSADWVAAPSDLT